MKYSKDWVVTLAKEYEQKNSGMEDNIIHKHNH
jgi:hypothetical protein